MRAYQTRTRRVAGSAPKVRPETAGRFCWQAWLWRFRSTRCQSQTACLVDLKTYKINNCRLFLGRGGILGLATLRYGGIYLLRYDAMATRRNLSSGWNSYEVYQRDGRGNHAITPFSDALAAPGKILAQPVTKMRMVQDLGWPGAKRHLKDDHGHPLVVKKDDVIWLLKCKPSCWRLYFYVYENGENKRIIYVHAVCKKSDQEDAGDAVEARRIADGIRPGGSAITPFQFPVG